VESWISALNSDGTGSDLRTELSLLLVPSVTKSLPEAMRLNTGSNAIETWISERKAESDLLCVRHKQTQALLGLLILAGSTDAKSVLEIRMGFLLAEDVWGKGIATELIQGFVAWCRNQPQDVRLMAGVEKENTNSASVLLKAEFGLAPDLSTEKADAFQLNIFPG
jgi:ribosomal-protein-alanine N-acetyltransferase